MSFWARTTESRDKRDWQLLRNHLIGVASTAKCFAETFDAGELGWLAGLCHDLGKYSPEFQKRLEDPRIHVDHSTAGAALAFNKYGPLGRLLAYAVAGHHSGLPNGGGTDEADLLYRVTRKEIGDFSRYASEIELPECVEIPAIRPQPGGPGFSAAFLVRMLFSCLVDADFLDAERFLDSERFHIRTCAEQLTVLQDRLISHLKQFAGAPRNLVNVKRAEVLEDCLNAAERPPGLFTLTVPTGGGKTLSSLAFALKHALLHGLRRVIYVIPFTSIIEQNARVFRNAVGADVMLEHHSNVAPTTDRPDGYPTRAELAEQNWDIPLVITTNVQFFESLFSNRPARCRKLHNIAKSVVILDEAQTLPVEILKPCVAAIYELAQNYGTTVVLCSATQPALDGLFPRGVQTREIIRNPSDLYRSLKRVKVKSLGTINDQRVVEHLLGHEQVLCIVNTRAHARRIFELLGKSDGHYHLSAAMCPKHRTKCLDEIRSRLSRGERCRVISTQLIEAGVDVDFPVVMRAVAGIDSIAQAAGRCNREGKRDHGDVFVFTPAGGEGMSHVWFRRTAAIASSILEEEADPLNLTAVKRYFRDLYFYEGSGASGGVSGGLDAHDIMGRIEVGGRALDFPFRDLADLFKVIGDDTIGVVVPYDEQCESILDKIRILGVSRHRVRWVQQYTVSVRPWEYQSLQEAGLLEDVGGLPVLCDMCAYDKEAYGLKIDAPREKRGDAWIV